MTHTAKRDTFSQAKVICLRKSIIHLGLLLASFLISTAACRAQNNAPTYGYRIVHTYPHDPQAFTQGLIYLTWKKQTGFVYDRATFHLLRTFHYTGEGWGLTQDGAHLIMSDGSPSLRFLDPQTFHEVKRIVVTDGGVEVHDLNELEYIHGQIYANVWQTDLIAIISPQTGHVTGWIDLSGLRPASTQGNSNAVLNGIAFDAAHNRLFVTGKLWPKLFGIQLLRKSSVRQK